jgi:hypothetical protein
MRSSRIIEIFIVFLFISLAIFIGFRDEIVIPGRVSMNTYIIERPWTFFISGSIFSLAGAITLMNVDKEKFKHKASALLLFSVILFGIGFISPITA